MPPLLSELTPPLSCHTTSFPSRDLSLPQKAPIRAFKPLLCFCPDLALYTILGRSAPEAKSRRMPLISFPTKSPRKGIFTSVSPFPCFPFTPFTLSSMTEHDHAAQQTQALGPTPMVPTQMPNHSLFGFFSINGIITRLTSQGVVKIK